ncbi:MAG: 4-hydroxy-tetrahydrodipicolinate synthase [Planctomycetota bacterium]
MFRGSIVALVTPFRADGSVDEEVLRQLVRWHLDQGTDAIVPCGTTGESPTLTHDEHREVIAIVVDEVKRRVPVIAGTGSNSTHEAVSLTRFAAECGADAALVVSPYYNRPSPRGIETYYKTVADASALPVIIYNVPARTGSNVTPDVVARLATHPRIVAIKEASGSLDQAGRILKETQLTVLAGDDALTLPLMCLGAKGVVSVAANVMPRAMHRLTEELLAPALEAARELHFRLHALFGALFIESNPGPVKEALELMGRIPSARLRPPLAALLPENREKLRQVLHSLDLLPG